MKTSIRKHITTLLGIFVVAIFLQSCATKSRAINQLRNLSSEIQYNGVNYSVDDWKRTAYKYYTINKKIAKYKYNSEESREIGRLNGECLGYFATSVGTNLVGKVVNATSGLGGLLEGLKEAFGF